MSIKINLEGLSFNDLHAELSAKISATASGEDEYILYEINDKMKEMYSQIENSINMLLEIIGEMENSRGVASQKDVCHFLLNFAREIGLMKR